MRLIEYSHIWSQLPNSVRRFRGYQKGSPDAFRKFNDTIEKSIETYYVDGVAVTYGSPGDRHHVYTYAAGLTETTGLAPCPCAGGYSPPLFVVSDYYCESGNLGPGWDETLIYSSDVLWDRQQCGGNEITCCNPPNLPWLCKTFPTPISEDLEVRICTDQSLDDENVAIESFELYIQGENSLVASKWTLNFTSEQAQRVCLIPQIYGVLLFTYCTASGAFGIKK